MKETKFEIIKEKGELKVKGKGVGAAYQEDEKGNGQWTINNYH